MAIYFEHEDTGLVTLRVSGVLTRAESDVAKQQVIAVIERHGSVNVLVVMEADFASLEEFVSWDDDHDDEFIQKHVNRLAIVGDLRWRDSALLFFLKGFLPFSIEFFKTGHEDFAKAWLIHP